jgi:hypothetical protein
MREWEQKYHQHKYRAERRGIPFELTFKQWLQIWQDSGHLHERGHRQGQYVMARLFGRGRAASSMIGRLTSEAALSEVFR